MTVMVGTSRGRRRSTRNPRAAVRLLLTVACALMLAGCTEDPGKPRPQRPQVALEIALAGGASTLTPQRRDDLQAEIGDVLSSYVVGAFLGDYPRGDFVRSLDSFTSGVAPRAAKDLDLLTASEFKAARDVVAKRLVASITAFAPDGEALGATARIDFTFDVTEAGGSARALRLQGRLMLAPENGSWKIFGYDVNRDDLPAAGGSS
jgi:hypothetical protein